MASEELDDVLDGVDLDGLDVDASAFEGDDKSALDAEEGAEDLEPEGKPEEGEPKGDRARTRARDAKSPYRS
jgi:hypothetical protein